MTSHTTLVFTRFASLFMFAMMWATVSPAVENETLRLHPSNPRYLTVDGETAIYLTGSHTWLNLQDGGATDPPPPFDYDAYLDLLEQNHHNFIRLWNWEGTSWVWSQAKSPREFSVISPSLYRRAGSGIAIDGRPKFDLDQLNPDYFSRLRQRVVQAQKRGMFVSIKLFEGFSIASKSKAKREKNQTAWISHPYNAANNINGIDGDPNGDHDGYEVHSLEIPSITRLQEAYVRKVIDTVNDLDNVIFEISNESHGGSTEWQYHLIRFIRQCENSKPKQHLVWMSFQWDGFDRGTNAMLFQSTAEIVSPAGHERQAKSYMTAPIVADGAKVSILDTDHINPQDRSRVGWMWKSFLRGHHTVLMDDPFGDVISSKEMSGVKSTRLAMGDTRRFADRMNLAAMTPTDDRAICSTGFCLQSPTGDSLVYQPRQESRSTSITLQLPKGNYDFEWFHPDSHKTIATGDLSWQGGRRKFTPPTQDAVVLYLNVSKPVADPNITSKDESSESSIPISVRTGGPTEGDVFREFAWTNQRKGVVKPLLVFSPDAKIPEDPRKRAPRQGSIDLDITHAIRAEVVVEHWSGHYGTSEKSIRFNQSDWMELPLPRNTVGGPECHPAVLSQSVVEVPLEHLKQGTNEFFLTCGKQLCRARSYSAFSVLGITVRVYYDASVPHPTGRIVSPTSGAKLDDHPTIEVDAESETSKIQQVELIGEYLDFDWEGNGLFHQWHYAYSFTKRGQSIGTTTQSPYQVKWDTSWVPDQAKPIRVRAWITDETGMTFVTSAIDNLSFQRDRQVKLYRPQDGPQRFNSRAGKKATCLFRIEDDLGKATSARLIVATHGPHEEPAELGINGKAYGHVKPELPAQAPRHFQTIDIPVDALQQGTNTFHALCHTQAHSIEILWPGPVLLVEFKD